MNNFKYLWKKLEDCDKTNYKILLQDRLFILLMKLKTRLSFDALGVIFCIDRSTISRIFHSLLGDLASITLNLVFWPTKEIIQDTMPKFFYPTFSYTKLIINCTEFKIDVPINVDYRVLCYSHYKKTFTAKLLIGITLSGFISFKCKLSGGRNSDSQITVESG